MRKVPPRETLVIKGGSLGAVGVGTIEVRPFTVLIGKQGTGKSLVAQVLYFFRAFPYLLSYFDATRTNGRRPTVEETVKSILGGLRSSQRAFAVFANPSSVSLSWEERSRQASSSTKLGLSLYYHNRRARPHATLTAYVDSLRSTAKRKAPHRAVFVPTERLFYSQITTVARQVASLPLTFELFAEWMDIASRYHSDKLPPSSAAMWVRTQGRKALAGEWYLHGDGWKWRVRDKRKTITFDVDMASSGQRSTWPLLALAETLLIMRMQGELDEMTIYVEEPEIHLHPEAQVAIIEILAFLVNQGFRVVITTHSLIVLYTLNNLTQAAMLGALPGADLPDPRVRIAGSDVVAWLLDGSEPRRISDEAGYIDQAGLGSVAEHLGDQLNAIAMMQRRHVK